MRPCAVRGRALLKLGGAGSSAARAGWVLVVARGCPWGALCKRPIPAAPSQVAPATVRHMRARALSSGTRSEASRGPASLPSRSPKGPRVPPAGHMPRSVGKKIGLSITSHACTGAAGSARAAMLGARVLARADPTPRLRRSCPEASFRLISLQQMARHFPPLKSPRCGGMRRRTPRGAA